MITKNELKEIDAVTLTKCLLTFNNIIRREIINKENKDVQEIQSESVR